MGCWDIFCCLCGNPCHSLLEGSEEVFLDNITYYEKIKNSNDKKYQYSKNKLKSIYEYYIKHPDYVKIIKSYYKITNWMNDCTFLTIDNRIVHHCKEVSCNIEFKDNKNNIYIHNGKEELLPNYGVFVHTDCWKYVKNQYKINLNYSHLPIEEQEITSNQLFNFIEYDAEKYWSQDYDFFKAMIENKNLLFKPSDNNSSVPKQIKKVITKLKIRLDKNRKSPISSASFYKVNTYKIGLNSNIWVIKGGKWMELPSDSVIKIKILLTDKQAQKMLKKLSYIGEINMVPVFILGQTSIKKNIELEILCTKELSNSLIKIK